MRAVVSRTKCAIGDSKEGLFGDMLLPKQREKPTLGLLGDESWAGI